MKLRYVLFVIALVFSHAPSANADTAPKGDTDSAFIGNVAYAMRPQDVPSDVVWHNVTASVTTYTIGAYTADVTATSVSRVEIRWHSGDQMLVMPLWQNGSSNRWVMSDGTSGRGNLFDDKQTLVARFGFSCSDTYVYLKLSLTGWKVGVPNGSGRTCPAIPKE